MCHTLLRPTQDPRYRPGYLTGESYCAKHLPRPHVIYCNVMSAGWSVTFLEADLRTAIGPWLVFDSHDEVLAILAWGRITEADLAEHHRNLGRWGVGGGALHLTSRQRHQLIERRLGWPWNGYELLQMKAAGRYPPQRLTQKQEDDYSRRHASQGKSAWR